MILVAGLQKKKAGKRITKNAKEKANRKGKK
jgi:hypothetical protein